jgi:succinate dehydrogenase hydrophobic anchor subunit
VLDSVRREGVRRAINGFFVILGAVLMALGTIIVVTFDPSKWPTS